MAAAEEFNVFQRGFDQITESIAQGDPAVGQLVSSYVDQLAGPMSKRMGINPQALKQVTMQAIAGHAREKVAEQSRSQKKKMSIAQTVGQAKRASDLKIKGIDANLEQFNKNLIKRYVGTVISAVGAGMGQLIAAGVFDPEKTLSTPEQLAEYDDYDAMDMGLDQGQGVPGSEGLPSTARFGMQARGIDEPNTEQSMDPSAFGAPSPSFDPAEFDALAQRQTLGPADFDAQGRIPEHIKRQKDLGSYDLGVNKGQDPLTQLSGMRQKREDEKFSQLGSILGALRGVA